VGDSQLDTLRLELRDLRASWEWAFAMGHGCSVGDHPRFAKTRQRDRDLVARIQELAP
jgi:hypothetical protein